MSGAICAICYEDARPTFEDLQSISACGHVFHELCLQQWMEYCPAGRKPTCPVCKQSCSTCDVHRLYFQSAGIDPIQGSPSIKPPSIGDPNQIAAPAVHKLEGQLGAAKAALKERLEQLRELDAQVVANLQRAEKAEGAHGQVHREWIQCKQRLTTTQEHASILELVLMSGSSSTTSVLETELRFCSEEQAKLRERNVAISKDLAAHKLVADADLGEEEVMRLANLGSGSNKNTVIETLTKSLILRNKSYKELMARCNELGLGESRALRKSEKTAEQLKRLKTRVQELEKAMEEKENAHLRNLKDNSKSNPRKDARFEDQGSAESPLGSQRDPLAPVLPATPPLERSASFSTLCQSRNTKGRAPEDAMKGLSSLNIVKERGQMTMEHRQQCRPDIVDTTINEMQEEDFSSERYVPERDLRRSTMGATAGIAPQREEEELEQTGVSIWKVRAQNLLRKVELLKESEPSADQVQDCKNPQSTRSGADQAMLSLQLRHKPGPLEEGLSTVASSSTCREQHPEIPPVLTSLPEVNFNTFPTPSSTSEMQRNTDRGHASASSLVSTVPSFGAFGNRATAGKANCNTPSSRFILSGADGRGGRVTIFKPPSITMGRGGCAIQGSMGISTTIKAKRPKVSGAGFGSRQGALQIEHFFGRATPK